MMTRSIAYVLCAAALSAGTERAPEPPMVTIPAGAFTMGDSGAKDQQVKPAHEVSLPAFEIDRTEVAVRDYKKCVDAGVCAKITSSDPGLVSDDEYFAAFELDEPIREVSWTDADTFCRWAGKRLPLEAEWEKASRGPRGFKNPWGDRALKKGDAAIGTDGMANAGSHPHDVSGYGVADTAGNVMEWVQDWYSKSYYAKSPRENPPGPASGAKRVVRGGSWQTNVKGELKRTGFSTTRFGDPPETVSDVIGFRCARSSAPPDREKH